MKYKLPYITSSIFLNLSGHHSIIKKDPLYLFTLEFAIMIHIPVNSE